MLWVRTCSQWYYWAIKNQLVILSMGRSSQSKLATAPLSPVTSTNKLERHKIDFPSLVESVDPELVCVDSWLSKYEDFLVDRHALKPRTVRMIASTIRLWDRYCLSLNVYSFPIEPNVLLEWLRDKRKEGARRSTLVAYRAHLSYIHSKIFNVEDPTKNAYVIGYIRSLVSDQAETSGFAEKERQALPFRHHHLKSLISLTKTSPNNRNMRDLCLITMLYGTMLRFDEVRKVRIHQLHMKTVNGSLVIQFNRLTSKTSDSPEPKVLKDDFATIVQSYLKEVCSTHGPNDFVFGSNYGMLKGNQPINESTINRMFKRLWSILPHTDIEPVPHTLKSWSAHSCRVGGAIDAYEVHKLKEESIMSMGDWTRETLMRYLRNSSVKASASTGIQDRLG